MMHEDYLEDDNEAPRQSPLYLRIRQSDDLGRQDPDNDRELVDRHEAAAHRRR